MMMQYENKEHKECSYAEFRSCEVKTDPPYLFRNLRGPAPRHPEGLECCPRPALTPKGRGPRLGVPEAGPCPGH